MLDRRRFLIATALSLPACRHRPRGDPAVLVPADAAACRSGPLPRPTAAPNPAISPLHPDSLARFVDRLPIPRVLAPEGLRADPHDPHKQIPYYRIAMAETRQRMHRDLPPTRFWTYGGTVPGPTLETRSGRGLLVEWRNELPDRHFLPIDHALCGAGADRPEARAVVHVHGARVPAGSDGYPEDWLPPGRSALYHYPNRQDATALWYHDHAMGIERLNQYAGLFGMFLIRDEFEEGLRLPQGRYELPLMLCDRLFDAGGQLVYPTSGMPGAPWISELNGDAHLVNGTLFPYLDVEPRPYRLRIVNASNSRFYYLSLSGGQTFQQIGTDQGLLPSPVPLSALMLSPAERADVVVDFSAAASEKVLLQSQTLQLMQFRVAARGAGGPSKTTPLPPVLRPVDRIAESAAVKTRTLTLNEYEDPKTHVMLMLLNGARWSEPVTERPALGSVEIWAFMNLTQDIHPIHLHLVRFQLLDRQPFDADEYLTKGTLNLVGAPVPPEPNEAGWKDTVRAEPGMITRIIVRFDGFAGRYVWHCHVLEHAANEMMRPYEVVG